MTPLHVYSEKYYSMREQRMRIANEDLIENYVEEEEEAEGNGKATKKSKAKVDPHITLIYFLLLFLFVKILF